MGTGGYKISDQGAMYFVSFAVVGWVDVFTRKEYRDVVIESLKFFQENLRIAGEPSPAKRWRQSGAE